MDYNKLIYIFKKQNLLNQDNFEESENIPF